MDWRKYEKEIYNSLIKTYPNTDIIFNTQIKGRYSKQNRQIDILVEGRIAGSRFRLIIDGKYYNTNLDIKDVEAFISMVDDVEADKGLLITSKGYSKAAINRAYYGHNRIELDILNFDELLNLQGFGGIMYSGKYGALVPAPFGWIIDATQRGFAIATSYQRGKDFEIAQKYKEWMYFNICEYKETDCASLDHLLELHENDTKTSTLKVTFEYSPLKIRSDGANIILRTILREEYEIEEYTGLIDFKTHCFFCVLFTPKELKEKNIKKLEYIIENLIPMNVQQPTI